MYDLKNVTRTILKEGNEIVYFCFLSALTLKKAVIQSQTNSHIPTLLFFTHDAMSDSPMVIPEFAAAERVVTATLLHRVRNMHFSPSGLLFFDGDKWVVLLRMISEQHVHIFPPANIEQNLHNLSHRKLLKFK